MTRRRLPDDEAKIRYLAQTAMHAIDKAANDGKVPIVMIIASPLDGWEHADIILPSNFPPANAVTILQDAIDAIKRKANL